MRKPDKMKTLILYTIYICISEDEIQGKRIPTRGLGPKGKHLHELPMKIKFLAKIFFSVTISWSLRLVHLSHSFKILLFLHFEWCSCSFILNVLFLYFACSVPDDDLKGAMDNLLDALKTGSAFNTARRKRNPRPQG